MAPRVEEAKVDLTAVFRKWDAEGKGFIDRGALEIILTKRGLPKSDAQQLLAAAASSCGDGRVHYEEFLNWLYGGPSFAKGALQCSTKVCAVVVDAGSSGNRVYLYTSQNMAPAPSNVPLSRYSEGSRICAFIEMTPPGDFHVLDMTHVVMAHSGNLGKIPDWLHAFQRPGDLTAQLAATLAEVVSARCRDYDNVTVQVLATAGVRELREQSSDFEKKEIDKVLEAIGKGIDAAFSSCPGVTSHGIQVLSAEEEGKFEAEAVRAAAAVPSAGLSSVDGVFSMGGMSSQFSAFTGGATVQLLLEYGFKQAKALAAAGGQDVPAAVAAAMQTSLKEALKGAPECGAPWTGMWVGISSTVWAATGDNGQGLPGLAPGKVYPYKEVKQKVAAALSTEMPNVQLKAQLLVLDFMLENLFNSNSSSFYFRRAWETPNGAKLTTNWATALAMKAQPALGDMLKH